MESNVNTARAAGIAFGASLRGMAEAGGQLAIVAKSLPFTYWDKGSPMVVLDADGFAARLARKGEKDAVKFKPYYHCPLRTFAIAAYIGGETATPDEARESVAHAPATVQRYVASRVKAEALGLLDDMREKAAKRQAAHQRKVKDKATKAPQEPSSDPDEGSEAPKGAANENSLLGVFRAIPADKRVAAMVHMLTEAYPKEDARAGFLTAVFDKLGIEPVEETAAL